MRRLFLLVALLTVFSSAAMAQLQPAMPQFLADHKARGAQVYYLGKYDILDGWALVRTGQPEFYYSTPGSNALVMGLLFDKAGNLLTAEQLKALPRTQDGGLVDMMADQLQKPAELPTPDAALSQPVPSTLPPVEPTPAQTPVVTAPAVAPVPAPAPVAGVPAAAVSNEVIADTPANQMFAQVRSGAAVLLGNSAAPSFYAFVDPNCPHCQRFLKEVEPYVNAGTVSVKLLPVGFDEPSKKQAAFALGTADGGARFVGYAKGDMDLLPVREGLNTEAVMRNVNIMETWMLNATPIVVYKSAAGQVKIVKGRPVDLAGAVKDLTGK